MNRLRELRKQKGVTAEKMAEILGISVRHLYDIEVGKVQLAEERISYLCSRFNITSDWLLGIETITVKDKRLPDGEVSIKVKPDWNRKGINTKEKIEKLIDRIVAYEEIVNSMERKKE